MKRVLWKSQILPEKDTAKLTEEGKEKEKNQELSLDSR